MQSRRFAKPAALGHDRVLQTEWCVPAHGLHACNTKGKTKQTNKTKLRPCKHMHRGVSYKQRWQWEETEKEEEGVTVMVLVLVLV